MDAELMDAMTSFTHVEVLVPSLYPWVMAETVAIAFVCIVAGFMAGSKRSTLFNEEFMNLHFKEEHERAFPDGSVRLPKGGYPDHGNGRYSDKLSYADWYAFNCDQRAHKNILESIAQVCFCLLVSGIVFPVVTIILGGLHLLGRIVYIIGYRKSAQGRTIGAMISMMSLMMILLLGLAATITWCVLSPYQI